MKDNKPLKPIEVAEISGVTMKTVYRWLNQKKLTGYQIGKRTWRVDPVDLKIFLESRGEK